jgi:pimeloyl-ACP methyl ester carboxylesterase
MAEPGPAPRTVEPALAMVRAGGKTLETALYRQPRNNGHQPGTADTIVFLHEALGSVSHWRDFPAALGAATGCDVLLYSRAGHGASEGPPATRSAEHYINEVENVLPAVLAHFGIRRPIFFGHSEGTIIALLYAASHADSTRVLILEAPLVMSEPASAVGMEMALVAWKTTDFRERLARHHQDPDGVFAAWMSLRDSMPAEDRDLTGQLSRVACPLLIFLGDQDEFVSTLQTDRIQAELPQTEVVVIPDCGHTPHRERPELVLARSAAFLAALRQAPSST